MFDKVVDHAQAEAGTFAKFLGCEERLKRSLNYLGRHATAGIADGNDDIVSRPEFRTAYLSLRCQGGVPGGHVDAATVWHRIAGVDGYVEECELYLDGVDVNLPQLVGARSVDRNLAGDRPTQQFFDAEDELVEVDV